MAYLSQQLGLGLHLIQMGVAAVLCLMMVWLAYDFGSELQDKRFGRAMALAMLGGLGLFTAYMDSHYTTLLALVFALAFLTFVIRYLQHRYLADAIAAGLMLGAVVLSSPRHDHHPRVGLRPLAADDVAGQAAPDAARVAGAADRRAAGRVLGIAPWLLHVRDLLGANITSPFARDPNYWQVMIIYQGIVIVPFALIGAVVGLRRRSQAAILAVGWLMLVLDFSTTGIIARLFPWLPILRYDYPFSIAWHGPIIPYTILGGMGLLWVWDRLFERRVGDRLHRYAPALLVGLSALALVGLALSPQLIAISKDQVGFYGAFSSAADVSAMEWIKANTPPDARVLNYPVAHEGDWVPVISERDSVYFRPQPFFQGQSRSRRSRPPCAPSGRIRPIPPTPICCASTTSAS